MKSHFTGSFTAKFNREIRPAIPGVHLAHTGKVKILDWRLNGRHIAGVVDQRNRLRKVCAEQPAGPDPARVKLRIDALETWKEPFDQLFAGQRKIFMSAFQVIAAVEQVVAAEMFNRHKVGMLTSARKGKPAVFGRLNQ